MTRSLRDTLCHPWPRRVSIYPDRPKTYPAARAVRSARAAACGRVPARRRTASTRANLGGMKTMDSIQREKKRARAKVRCAEDPEYRARKLAASGRYYSRNSETIVVRASEK
jgi:hypothetical protein